MDAHTLTGHSPHVIEQKDPGKFDCSTDAWILREFMDFADGFGDTEEYGLYVSTITLDPECTGHPDDDHSIAAGMPAGESHYCDGTCTREGRAAVHYGSPYLLTLEDRSGFVKVHAFINEDARDLEFQRMSELYYAWCDRVEETV